MRRWRERSALYGALWVALVIGVVCSRPPWPIDETRYLAVAWEMWARGDFLVPYLNGAPYTDKPPLLFWLFHLGWALFGVNEWWPRLVPPLFAFAAVALTVRLARRLWPDCSECPRLAAWILFGSLLWIAFTTLLMFDMLIVCCTLLGMLGLIDAARGAQVRGFVWYGLAVGLGLLAKGPVILVYTLPPALLAPWWMAPPRIRLLSWYLGFAAALGLGIGIALLWALPAAQAGGAEYRASILWNQTAGRMAASFAHRAPWWWYLPVLPLIVFPWMLWPPLWRALVRAPLEPGVRVLLAWLVPAFVGLSLISGKQPHYLLPLFPAFALLAAFALSAARAAPRRRDVYPPVLALAGLGGVALLVATGLAPALPDVALSLLPGIGLLAIGLVIVLFARTDIERQVRLLALATVLVAGTIYGEFVRVLGPAYDVRPLATHLAALERTGIPLAHVGKYHGQYQFLGRMRRPIEVIEPSEIRDWLRRHPRGHVITYQEGSASGGDAESRGLVSEYEQSFRGGRVRVVRG